MQAFVGRLHGNSSFLGRSFSPLTATSASQPPLQLRFKLHRSSRVSSATAVIMPDYTLYYFPTPNGKKISLALEEMRLSYDIKVVHIGKDDQFAPSFVKLNPNSKIPALVDHTLQGPDFAVWESAAILEYLSEKTGLFGPSPASGEDTKDAELRAKYVLKEWLAWQVAGFGPMMGQLGHFHMFSKEDVPYAKERYLKEALRLFGVLDARLAESTYMAGEQYSIADMATYFWSLSLPRSEEIKSQFAVFKNVKRWQDAIGAREAVARVNAIKLDK